MVVDVLWDEPVDIYLFIYAKKSRTIHQTDILLPQGVNQSHPGYSASTTCKANLLTARLMLFTLTVNGVESGTS